MIDHILGRPSIQYRKTEIFVVALFWSFYLSRGDRHGPPVLRRLSGWLSGRLTAWQTVVITMLWIYVGKNVDRIVGLECPEPLANLYTRSYFRATWITTALDAGFWSAMRVRRKWARDLLSVLFSLYYLFRAEQADQKVRKVRAVLTVDHLRVSWNKGTTPYLAFLTSLLRPQLMRYPPRAVRIPRPDESSYRDPVKAWLYFDGPLASLGKQDKIVLDIPGGGFVAMDPRKHDDKLFAWAARSELPVLSLDYRKAPEHPYPYALNECYDVYHSLITSRGRCIGLAGDAVPKIVVAGDSAGGNLAVGLVLMVLQSGSTDSRRWHGEKTLPPPQGLVLVYPTLDMNIGNWMSDEQMALIRDRRLRKINQAVLRRKSQDYRQLDTTTPHPSDDEFEPQPQTPARITSREMLSAGLANGSDTPRSQAGASSTNPQPFRTRLAMSSVLSYFNDRILTPEMMRAMIILYIGPHHKPDFSTDYLLSPILAPEQLLARFPKTFFLTGERDPLVDDTVIFAGRIRQAKAGAFQERKDLGLLEPGTEFNELDHVEVALIPGISHGFLQFVGVFPQGWTYIFRAALWMRQAFNLADRDTAVDETSRRSKKLESLAEEAGAEAATRAAGSGIEGGVKLTNGTLPNARKHHRTRTASSGDEDRPLEMTSTRSPVTRRTSQSDSPKSKGERTCADGTGSPGKSGKDAVHAEEKVEARTRKKSFVSLTSEDDLVARRMRDLAMPLLGRSEILQIPPTPGTSHKKTYF